MSARDITPENLPKWLAYYARHRAAATQVGEALARCEHGHYNCSPIYNGTCGAAAIGAYDCFHYRGALVEVRWTPYGWQHRIDNRDDPRGWSGEWNCKEEADSDAGERIDLAHS